MHQSIKFILLWIISTLLVAVWVYGWSGLTASTGDILDATKWNSLNSKVDNNLAMLGTLDKTAYAVNSGPRDVNGYASFISKVDNSTISFGLSESLIFTFATWRSRLMTSIPNLTWLSNGTSIIIIEWDDTTAKADNLTTNTVSEWYVRPTGVNGDYFLDIWVKPYKWYKKVSGSWTDMEFVKLGEATVTAGVMATPISYALNGMFVSQLLTIPVNGTSITTVSDNIGTTLVQQSFEIINTIAEWGFNPWENAIPSCYDTNAADAPPQSRKDKNTASFTTWIYWFYIQVKQGTSGTRSITRTSWVARFINKRSF